MADKCSCNARSGPQHFDNMISNCLEYATAAKADGRPIVGIMCEFTPRELIMAAGGVPTCLCGGSADTIPADFEEYEKTLELLRKQQPPCEAASRVRVLMTGVPMAHGAERVLDIVEDCGGLVVAMENCTGLKPILNDVDVTSSDTIAALAETYFHLPCSVMTPNVRRLDSIGRLAETYRPECVIELIWQACLTYDVESRRVRHFAEEMLGIPYLRIETDWSMRTG